MSSLDGLIKLGIFVRPNFLDEILCAKLCEAIASSDRTAAEVYDGERLTVAEDVRQTRQTLLHGQLRETVQDRLDALVPEISEQFAMPLARTEGVSFLMYEPGGFFRPHRDKVAPETSRLASAVVFLNLQAEQPGPMEYSGGQLTLYDLIPDAPAVGFPVPALPGLLIAFNATTLHEVTPVREGRRMTAVDWFF